MLKYTFLCYNDRSSDLKVEVSVFAKVMDEAYKKVRTMYPNQDHCQLIRLEEVE